ncbi:MAG: UDP-N-acetylglucosamine 2-epimerase (non-hydrolyzing) [Acidobacteria bacterium]|nr:UDP-N-acetylglucosamine 2-epimerase (non-hydrolyzing) [Acidobacteriota bacterium]
MLVTIVAGARPNFMKISPVIKAIKAASSNGRPIDYRLVHTGQHFDQKMSGEFFDQLGIPEPNINLECGGGSQAEQTAAVMVAFEHELEANRPDVVLVVGDVTSTMACTITAKKLCVPVVHVEAGIRSGDMTMPEEINRIVTDSICDHFFTTTTHAGDLLRRSGVDEGRIHFVGNTMIDSLYQNLDRLKKPDFWDTKGLSECDYFLLTLHRPGNVDDPAKLVGFLDAILSGTGDKRIVFPVHPRTRKTLQSANFDNERLIQADPLGYLEFIYLLKYSAAVITDSGGITEEATVLNIPCMTLRDSTERPETVEIGTNELVGTNPNRLAPYLEKLVRGSWKQGRIPELWDGKTSQRIVDVLIAIYSAEAISHAAEQS